MADLTPFSGLGPEKGYLADSGDRRAGRVRGGRKKSVWPPSRCQYQLDDMVYSQIGVPMAFTVSSVSSQTAANPLPPSILLLVSGLLGLGALGWRRRRQ